MDFLNHQFDLIRQSPTVAMADRVNELRSSGVKIIGLQTGDPDFSTHSAIIEVALDAMRKGQTHYGPSRGLIELRQAAALKLERDNEVLYNPDTELLVTHGGIHAYYLAMQALLNPGDDVLIPDPTWATHANMVTMLRGNVIRVPAPPENGFLPKMEDWRICLTPRTKALVINYPSNPTCVYPKRDYIEQLQEFAIDHHLWVVSDEVYENLYYDKHPVSAAKIENARQNTIIVSSLSKTYAMTGWRVGYLAAPRIVIDNALKASQNSITCVAPFIQKAAAFALKDPEMQKFAASMRAEYAHRRDSVMRLARELEPNNIVTSPPMGAFYYFLDFRRLGKSSQEICERILDEAGVGLVAGSAFGKCGEGFVRMTIAASNEDVEAGYKKIVEWADRQ